MLHELLGAGRRRLRRHMEIEVPQLRCVGAHVPQVHTGRAKEAGAVEAVAEILDHSWRLARDAVATVHPHEEGEAAARVPRAERLLAAHDLHRAAAEESDVRLVCVEFLHAGERLHRAEAEAGGAVALEAQDGALVDEQLAPPARTA
eukprot:CAMPEP_0182809634 /NCGR_PEP_ID=MMETSP0006_2-20121128/7289_1 /TAXON_ID=97485 /ORGANISM="Prymnesium parvum, Strain Texoma1" /LENGTH=146 /DNA_ID=CAMNT_0024935433 /DNA_START=272 /DNA_END=708 /DNA_ORIENTATION=+